MASDFEHLTNLLPGTCNAWNAALIQSDRGIVDLFAASREPNFPGREYSPMFLIPALVIDGSAVFASRELSPMRGRIHISEAETNLRPSRQTVADMLADVQDWTDWSYRRVAAVLGTTHPTIARLAQNITSARSSSAIESLRQVHGVLERLAPLRPDASDLAELLSQRNPASQNSVEELLRAGEYNSAYRLALTIVSGGDREMLGGSSFASIPATYPVDGDGWV
ncbi:hypothetical protein [Kribbella sp. CA-247076]|uniref:hypothetical protein n=1 Tax=Kribbella sp. CA-247076 TaxID=3239941 RepID=UPI003D9324BF